MMDLENRLVKGIMTLSETDPEAVKSLILMPACMYGAYHFGSCAIEAASNQRMGDFIGYSALTVLAVIASYRSAKHAKIGFKQGTVAANKIMSDTESSSI
jgi:hypothetical protein